MVIRLPDRATVRASWCDWWLFRLRPRGPAWLQWVWTVVFCIALAALMTLPALPRDGASWPFETLWSLLRVNLWICFAVGLLIHFFYARSTAWLGADRIEAFEGWRQLAYFIGPPVLGVAIGWPLGLELAGGDFLTFARDNPRTIRFSLGVNLLISVALYFYMSAKSRQERAERLATEAQLRLLQAQIEPHFLFNTLANVLSLIDAQPQRARAMLESFVDYLRSSLHQQRRDESTVGAELDLARAYLQVLATRMDARLRHRVVADDAARAARIPPLLLQPLIENAIRHGLEPTIEGGSVVVEATVTAERLRLSVSDDGRGLDAPRRAGGAGNGVALANIRARLAARYGERAHLTLESLHPGTRATLDLPLS